jgi:Ca2+:H+ antiporter
VLQRNDVVVFGITGAAVVAAGVLHFMGANDVLRFVVAAAALSLLAMSVSNGTEHVGEYLSPGATGVLQSALGNLPELLVCAFSLRAGLIQVVQGALIGSILGNSLLVLGIAIFVGGVKHGRQTFDAESPRMIVSLMMLAVAAFSIPTLAYELHTPASAHEVPLSAACAVLLLVVFFASLPFSLSADPQRSLRHAAQPATGAGHWPLGLAVTVLVLASAGAAVVSEWFVEALEPAIEALHISQAFAGIVVVAIAGNAVENVAGLVLAAKGQADLAISVVKNSVAQIAAFLFPALVLVSLAFADRLTFGIPPLYVGALLLTAISMWQVTTDGEATAFEGWALMATYGVLAIFTLYE